MNRRLLLLALLFCGMAGIDEGEASRRSSRPRRGAKRRSRSRRPRSGSSIAAFSGASYYPNCTAARADGAAPIRAGEAGYSRRLDRDGDGIACE